MALCHQTRCPATRLQTKRYHEDKLKELRRRLQLELKTFRWTTHEHSVIGCRHKYHTLLGIPYKHNKLDKCNLSKGIWENLVRHRGVRCMLIELCTQGTMLAHDDNGKYFITKLNRVKVKMEKLVKVKDWEHVMLTYESSFKRNVAMVSQLCKNLDISVVVTWRGLCAAIKGMDKKHLSDKADICNMAVSETVVNVNTSFKEAICRDALLHIYGKSASVIRHRPGWLKSPHSNRSLELDAYCAEMKVAVEYNGSQHYLFSDMSEMDNRVQKDLCKIKTTKNRGVELVVVPYIVPHNMIVKFILLRLATA